VPQQGSARVRWLREAKRLTEAARTWHEGDRDRDWLFQGDELRSAERWAARRPATAPPVSALVLEFMEASQDHEGERRVISEVERIRYQEIDRMTHDFLEEELKYREA
jgi:hypothetical protein